MKITFDSINNYIQFDRAASGKIYITLSAQNPKDLSKAVINSVELEEGQLLKLIESIGIKIKGES